LGRFKVRAMQYYHAAQLTNLSVFGPLKKKNNFPSNQTRFRVQAKDTVLV
jgi:hypothetical protein